jgi:hypothetical protein
MGHRSLKKTVVCLTLAGLVASGLGVWSYQTALGARPRGASLPFREYQAESAKTSGHVIGPSRKFETKAAEASGRKAVLLNGGQYVEFTLKSPANAVDIRYSIPDSSNGSPRSIPLAIQVNGVAAGDLTLTTAYSWFYGGYPFTNNPHDGGAHHFFDDVRTMFGSTFPAGAKVRLVASASTVIDLADFELVGPPLERPANSIAVTDYGADPTGVINSGNAFRDAIAAGQAQGKPVWIPRGTFYVTGHVIVDDVTLQGAGPWYSVLRGEGLGIYGNYPPSPSTNVRLSDFAIFGEVTERNDSAQVNGIGGALGGGSVISNIWIQHTKVGIWLDGPFDGLLVTGCRIQDVTADGLNLHKGISHAIVENTFVRNTGDDGLAMWSEGLADKHDTFRFDTVSLPILANNVAIYGGSNNSVTDSLLSDTVTEGGGIQVANRFASAPLAGTTTLARNTIMRAGSYYPVGAFNYGAITFYAMITAVTGYERITDTKILDSSHAAIQFVGNGVKNVRFDRLTIDGATFGVQVQSNGSASFYHATAKKLSTAGVFFCPTANHFKLYGKAHWLKRKRCGPERPRK